MADFYCDHGCTLYPSAYMSVPASSASLPQEGDGKASGTGATPAVASAAWDLTSASASSGTMTVMGATLTGLTASGSALATAIATAINASTAAVTTSTGGVSSPYLKALVWAVASGATLTVHTRIASADLNQSANASCIMATGTGWTSPPATANFSGGVSGPWTFFLAPAALTANISASVGPIGTYGAIVRTMMSDPTSGDTINVRSGRSSADITVTFAAALTCSTRTAGSASSYLTWKIDNGTVWSDGSSNGVFTLSKSTNGILVSIQAFGYLHLMGQMQSGTTVNSGGVPNFKIRHNANEATAYGLRFAFQSTYGSRHFVADCVETEDTNLGAAVGSALDFGPINIGTTGDSSKPCLVRNSKIGHIVRSASSLLPSIGAYGYACEYIDCWFALGSSVATYTKFLAASVGSTADLKVRFVRPKFTGGGGGHHVAIAWATPSSDVGKYQLVIEDPIDMGQAVFSDSSASLCGNISGIGISAHNDAGFQSIVGSGQFLHDTSRKLLEWRSAGFPTTGLSELQNGTPFSVRFSVAPTSAASGLISKWAPQRGIRQVNINTLGDQATLYATVRLLIDTDFGGSAYSPLNDEWWIEGTYVSSTDGSTKTFSTQGTGSALATDTTTWTALTYAPFSGGSRSYARYKCVATLTNVKDATEVVAYLMCGKQPATMVEWAFIDPLPGLST